MLALFQLSPMEILILLGGGLLCVGGLVAGIIVLVVSLTRKNPRDRVENLPNARLCPHCGKYSPERGSYCPYCGKPVRQPDISTE
jgi:hypothetical protein